MLSSGWGNVDGIMICRTLLGNGYSMLMRIGIMNGISVSGRYANCEVVSCGIKVM